MGHEVEWVQSVCLFRPVSHMSPKPLPFRSGRVPGHLSPVVTSPGSGNHRAHRILGAGLTVGLGRAGGRRGD